EAKAEEYLATAQRVQADFDNYRKRAQRDQESLIARAHERLVKELLPILDDLERALEAAHEHQEAQLEEGVARVYRAPVDLLAREFHPDKNPGDASAEDRFKEVQNAYDVLSDPDKRKQYDAFGNGRPGAGPGGQVFTNFDFGDIGDLFGGLFGGGARTGTRARPQPQRGAD